MNLARYERIPFADKGRDQSGVDCWGYVRLLYRHERGIELPSFVCGYSSADDKRETSLLIAANLENWLKVDRPAQWDVVLFRIGGFISHCGVCVDRQRFTHCMKQVGVSIERLGSIVWSQRIEGFYRYA